MFTVLPVFVKCFWNDAYHGTSIYNYINHDLCECLFTSDLTFIPKSI